MIEAIAKIRRYAAGLSFHQFAEDEKHDYTGGLSGSFRPNRTLASDRVLLPADERGESEGKAVESLKNATLQCNIA